MLMKVHTIFLFCQVLQVALPSHFSFSWWKQWDDVGRGETCGWPTTASEISWWVSLSLTSDFFICRCVILPSDVPEFYNCEKSWIASISWDFAGTMAGGEVTSISINFRNHICQYYSPLGHVVSQFLGCTGVAPGRWRWDEGRCDSHPGFTWDGSDQKCFTCFILFQDGHTPWQILAHDRKWLR